MYAIANENYLIHHGIKGQKWGIRKYQNPDGSLTAEGQKRYSGDAGILRRWRDANATARSKMSFKERLHSDNAIRLDKNKSYKKELDLTRKEFGLGTKGEAIAKNENFRQQGKFDRAMGIGFAAAGAGGVIATKILSEKGAINADTAKKAYAASGAASVAGLLSAGIGTITLKTATKNIADVKSGKVDPRKTYDRYSNLRNN